ncbi:hypothetical protein BDZ94DRAFT_1262484, partial [Collybia nuda]
MPNLQPDAQRSSPTPISKKKKLSSYVTRIGKVFSKSADVSDVQLDIQGEGNLNAYHTEGQLQPDDTV